MEQDAEARDVPNAETINLREILSRLGLQKGCDPADYNSRVVHRSAGLVINSQAHEEPSRASL